MPRYIRILSSALAVCVLPITSASFAAEEPASKDTYLVDYPATQQICPPVETYFDDASQALQKVGSRTIRHQLNGGYGLPVVDMAGGQHLLHLGSDVAWYQVGAPVYAIADGVVRISQPPIDLAEMQNAIKKQRDAQSADTSEKKVEPTSSDPLQGDLPSSESEPDKTTNPDVHSSQSAAGKKPSTLQPRPMGWGNIIVIEHHLPDDTYVTSIYGHLGNKRLVNKGDTVRAGQVIGFIGKAGVENGGFKPHLHFGLRDGRMFEPGCKLMTMIINGRPSTMTLVGFTDTEAAIKMEDFLPARLHMTIAGQEFEITSHDEKSWLPLAALNYMQRPEFSITGYGLSTKGWRDPTEFLLQSLDKLPRAAFGDIPSPKRVVADKRR
jgi:murein DD-endopeptidase MepM/ murein hydrolase activator NlpD